MKKILYLILLLPFFSLQSCIEDEKDIFDTSAAERIAAAMKEYRATIAAAENGWLLAYYPEKNHSIGGYNMIAKFTADGNVTLCSEVATTHYEMGDTVSSEYDIISDMGPVLTFNTYNEIIHYFTEPKGSQDVDGMCGDYEFVFMEVTPSKIVLKGKKYGNKLVMTRLDGPLNAKEYFQEVLVAEEASSYGNYNFLINEDTICIANRSGRVLTVSYNEINAEGETVVNEEDLAFTCTPTGIKLYEPFVYTRDDRNNQQVTMENFEWNEEQKSFICTDAGVDAKLAVYMPEGFHFYNDYLGNYTMKYTGGKTATVTISQKESKKTYTLSGSVFPYDLELKYDLGAGIIGLKVQKRLGLISEGLYMGIVMYDSSTNYLTWGDAGLKGVVSEENGKMVITMIDDKMWVDYKADSFYYYSFDDSGTRVSSYASQYGRFTNVVFVKQ